MELHQLEYFLAVAKYQNFTRAADEINVSQSSLSQQIGKLETELGIRLFERTTRAVVLTPAGNEFAAHANRIISEISQAKRTIGEYLSVEKGRLKIGFFPVAGNYGFTALIASFYKSYPGIKLDLVEAECEDLLEMLQTAAIDVAMLSETIPNPRLHYIPVMKDELVLVASQNHPLASRQIVQLKEIAGEKFILFHPNSGLYKNFIDACTKICLEPKIIYTFSRVETILGLVSEDIGVTLLSSKVADCYVQNDFAVVRFTPKIARHISLALTKNEHLHPTVKVFIKFVEQWLTLQSNPF